MSRRIYEKEYKVNGMEFSVIIQADVEVRIHDGSFDHQFGVHVDIYPVIDSINVVSIEVYDEDKEDYQNVYPDDKLYQSIEEVFLSDEDVGLEIMESN